MAEYTQQKRAFPTVYIERSESDDFCMDTF